MKILMIVERLPSRVGGVTRQYGLVRELAQRHDFTVACYAFPTDLPHLTELQRIVRRVEYVALPTPTLPARSHWYWRFNAWRHAFLDPYPRRGRFPERKRLHAMIQRLVQEESFDLIQVHQTYLADLLPRTGVATLLDMHDILSEYERQVMEAQTKPTFRISAWLEWKKMEMLERRAVRRFDLCTVVSENDQQRLQRLIPGVRTSVVTNGVDLNYFQPQPPDAQQPHVVFVGSMNYDANVDAVLYFSRAIWPTIRANHPKAQFYIVGLEPPSEIVALAADPQVLVTGYVEDVRSYLANSAVVIVPLRFGSGVRNKILEAWAMGKAVVSTPLGAEGLPAQHERNILLATDPQSFAHCVLQTLGDQAMREKLGAAGLQVVEEQYSWSAIGQTMEAVYAQLFGSRIS